MAATAQAALSPAGASGQVRLEEKRIVYDDGPVRWFIAAAVFFGLVGMLVGVLIALQLAFWQLNFNIPWLTYSRLRPLHTNAVIFALVGNMMFAGIYYSTQRLLKTRLASDLLTRIHFWGWQAIIVAAAISLPLGYTSSKEYAELEWPIDIAITVIWVVFAINFFWTLAKRNEKHLYVALWFYIATIVTIAVLHVINSLALPVSPFKSYPVFAGVQDALVQWWYGHNAVAFFLTTPILGIMYYFLPKAADRPVYSYRLSIVHFWSLVFLYIWAGPHHLLYTALPDWAQTLGMVFSVALWAPSWGGMLNGLLTLRGAWDKVRTDPVLKFLVAGVTFYGMATFEGPLLSIKSVSALGHYTDWIIAHVHGGALGWNGFMAAGMFYWLVPRLYGTKLHSVKAADAHFWMGTLGILLYMGSMWVSGIGQGLMWQATNPDGTLVYPDFVETLLAIRPLFIIRAVGGALYLVGFFVMTWNLIKTARSGVAVDGETTVVVQSPSISEQSSQEVHWVTILTGRPLFFTIVGLLLTFALGFVDVRTGIIVLVLLLALSAAAYLFVQREVGKPGWHSIIEGRPMIFTVFTLIAILIGGVAEIVPTLFATNKADTPQHPYTALELEGRDVYVAEGCYTCHSQMIRPLVFETMRYGEPSKPHESIFDHPFQWGSKRTGPDLARVGGKYPDLWHYNHMMDPRSTSVGSNMPAYPWLATNKVKLSVTPTKLSTLAKLGVPYSAEDISQVHAVYESHARHIVENLESQGVEGLAWDSEMVALIAYLQRLGKEQSPAKGTPVSAVQGSDAVVKPF